MSQQLAPQTREFLAMFVDGEDPEGRTLALAAVSDLDRIELALNDLVTAAEYISRPGVSGVEEVVAAAAMTGALLKCASLIGRAGAIIPELAG